MLYTEPHNPTYTGDLGNESQLPAPALARPPPSPPSPTQGGPACSADRRLGTPCRFFEAVIKRVSPIPSFVSSITRNTNRLVLQAASRNLETSNNTKKSTPPSHPSHSPTNACSPSVEHPGDAVSASHGEIVGVDGVARKVQRAAAPLRHHRVPMTSYATTIVSSFSF